MGLPTPLDVYKGAKSVIGSFLFAFVLILVMSAAVQWIMIIGGAVLLFYRHFYIGVILMVVAIIASQIRKSTHLF